MSLHVEPFVPALSLDEIPDRTAKTVAFGRKKICIVRVDDRFHAVDALCTHMGVPLDQGEFNGAELVCPWHAARFCVKTGAKTHGPGFCDLKTYGVRVANGWVEVNIHGPALNEKPAANEKPQAERPLAPPPAEPARPRVTA